MSMPTKIEDWLTRQWVHSQEDRFPNFVINLCPIINVQYCNIIEIYKSE